MSFFGEQKKYIACWKKIKRSSEDTKREIIGAMCYNQFGSNEKWRIFATLRRTHGTFMRETHERKLSNFLESNETRIRDKYIVKVFPYKWQYIASMISVSIRDTGIWQYFFFFFFIFYSEWRNFKTVIRCLFIRI